MPYYGGPVSYASKLSFGQNVAICRGSFCKAGAISKAPTWRSARCVAATGGASEAKIFSFQFDSGKGLQDGWARIQMNVPFAH
jgi:hypothetical protein